MSLVLTREQMKALMEFVTQSLDKPHLFNRICRLLFDHRTPRGTEVNIPH